MTSWLQRARLKRKGHDFLINAGGGVVEHELGYSPNSAMAKRVASDDELRRILSC